MQQQPLLLQNLQNYLGTSAFKIQMKKLYPKSREATTAEKLVILNYKEKENSKVPSIAEAGKRKITDISLESAKASSSKHPFKRD